MWNAHTHTHTHAAGIASARQQMKEIVEKELTLYGRLHAPSIYHMGMKIKAGAALHAEPHPPFTQNCYVTVPPALIALATCFAAEASPGSLPQRPWPSPPAPRQQPQSTRR